VTTRLHLVPRLRMNGTMSPLQNMPLCLCKSTTLFILTRGDSADSDCRIGLPTNAKYNTVSMCLTADSQSTNTHTHTHTHVCVYIYIYICVCVCVCVCVCMCVFVRAGNEWAKSKAKLSLRKP